MSSTYTRTATQAFTRAHAKKISYKVATDLKRMQRLYGLPTDEMIEAYDKEVVELLAAGLLGSVAYGYRRGECWIEPMLRYTAVQLADPGFGDDPGRVRPGADIRNASFCSFLTYSSTWDAMSAQQKEAIRRLLPVDRVDAPEPGVEGYLQQDLAYSAGGRGVQRETLRSWR